jgi:CRISPR-associated endonuclease/helicase Cas3
VSQDFEAFFTRATGHRPYGYQARIARQGLPGLVPAPTGAGKTGVILAWLWRRLHGPDPAGTPRRLIYALPQRSALDPLAGTARRWLENLQLTEQVALHVVLGDRGASLGDWRENMHQPAIVVGTADALVSMALNRGYGTERTMHPIDFALVTNGAHWIVDDAGLSPVATATLRQLAGCCAAAGTAEPFGLTCLSSRTADRPGAGRGASGNLAVRLGAVRTIRRAAVAPGDYAALAAAAGQLHRARTMTLVVLNTVPGAQQVYRGLRGGTTAATLLHPQLRSVERVGRLADVVASPADRIVVATGDVMPGLDLSAAVLLTEAAPWASMVQRAGRCNRTGAEPGAELWWVPPAEPLPSQRLAVEAACAELSRLDGVAVTGEDLAARPVFAAEALAAEDQDLGAEDQAPVIGRAELSALFDTSAARTDSDLDVGRYLRDAEDLDADVAWARWTPGEDGAPDPEVRYPAPEYRCRVPIQQAVELARTRPVWYLDRTAREWRRAGPEPRWRPRPYELLLVDAADGGYDPRTGFEPSSLDPVAESPQLLTPDELAERAAAEAAQVIAAQVTAAEPAGHEGAAESTPPPRWQSLDEHSERVRDQAAALLAVLAPDLPPGIAQAAVIAGYLHDAGKAHPIWQDALCAMADESEAEAIAAGRPWAKSGRTGRLEFAGGVSFRHELASVLLIDGPLHDLLVPSPDPDLTRYLVLAHHGQLRTQVREPRILGLEQGAAAAIPPMLTQPATTLTVELEQFSPDGARSWEESVLALLDRFGPFTLAYLETLVRMADWRASGGLELAGNNNAIDISAKVPQVGETDSSRPLRSLPSAMLATDTGMSIINASPNPC